MSCLVYAILYQLMFWYTLCTQIGLMLSKVWSKARNIYRDIEIYYAPPKINGNYRQQIHTSSKMDSCTPSLHEQLKWSPSTCTVCTSVKEEAASPNYYIFLFCRAIWWICDGDSDRPTPCIIPSTPSTLRNICMTVSWSKYATFTRDAGIFFNFINVPLNWKSILVWAVYFTKYLTKHVLIFYVATTDTHP